MSAFEFFSDDRAVSKMIGYLLTVGIAIALVSGLFLSGGLLVSEQRESTQRTQMDVIGHRVAGSLEAADRLAQSTEDEPRNLTLSRTLPESIVETSYTIEINSDSVVVEESGGDVAVTVGVETNVPLASTEVRGGPIEISYNGQDKELEVTRG